MSSTEIGIRCGLAAVALWVAYHPQSRYVVAGGDTKAIEGAKKTVMHSLVGFALALAAPVIITIIKSIVGV